MTPITSPRTPVAVRPEEEICMSSVRCHRSRRTSILVRPRNLLVMVLVAAAFGATASSAVRVEAEAEDKRGP